MSKIKIELDLNLNDPADLKAFKIISEALADINVAAPEETEDKKPIRKAPSKKAAKKEEAPVEEPEDEVEDVTLTVEEVRSTLATAKRGGKPNDQIRAILQEFGTTMVSGLDPKHYAAVVSKVKAL